MRRTLVVALVIGLIMALLLVPAEAKKRNKKPPAPVKIERVVEFNYACPCTGLLQLGGLTGGNPNLGGGPIPIRAGEIYLTGEATDMSGQPIQVDIYQDDGTGADAEVGAFCGSILEPILLTEGAEIRVLVGSVLRQSVLQLCPGPAVGGTIKFTLSNLP